MVLGRILVVDDSSVVRETLSIVLGPRYDVCALTCEQYRCGDGGGIDVPDLVVLGATATWVVPRVPPDVPLLRLPPTPAEPAAAEGEESLRTAPEALVPERLHSALAELIGRRPGEAVPLLRWTTEPILSAAAVSLVRAAFGNQVPVFLCGETGTGTRVIARAIHLQAARGTWLSIRGALFRADECKSAKRGATGTLFINGVDELNDTGQDRLLECLDSSGRFCLSGGGYLRMICAAQRDLATLVASGRFHAELYHKLTVLPVHLPPLRERLDDVPRLARVILRELGRGHGFSDAGLTEAAAQRLSRYLWFGNITELVTVLSRTLAVTGRSIIDADDLCFGAAPARVGSPRREAPPAAASDGGNLPADGLRVVANELAHQFKNPLVTIKTFAQQFQRAGCDEADRRQVADMTRDAVDQIDHTLENLLQFTRFSEPAPHPVSLGEILEAPVADLASLLAARGTPFDREVPPAVSIFIDPLQTTYAITNLFQALSRNVDAADPIVLRYRAPATLVIGLAARCLPDEDQLTSLLDLADAAAVLPLGVALAKAVLDRNGVGFAMQRKEQTATITLAFPLAERKEQASKNHGQTSYSDRR